MGQLGFVPWALESLEIASECRVLPFGALFTIWQGGMPIVHCAFAWTEEGEQELWALVEDLNNFVCRGLPGAKAATKPARLPWLAVILLPAIVAADKEVVSMLGDMERCIAWAIFEHQRKPAARPVAKLLRQEGEMVCIEPQNGRAFTLAELQAYVGGLIEILQPPGNTGASLVINELGKCSPGLVKNELASSIWQDGCELGSPRSQDDIVGNVVLCHTTQVP